MRRQWLYGAIAILGCASLVACAPYDYGYGRGYYGNGAYGYGPYGYGPYGNNPYGNAPYGYGPYGMYPPPPPAPTVAPPPPPPVVPLAAAPPYAPQLLGQAPYSPFAKFGCSKGLLWPFVRQPGDCPTDAEVVDQLSRDY